VTATPQPSTAPTRRLYRASNRRVIGGVARGLADHLGVDVLWIRIAFLLLIPAGGCGLVLYAVFWAVTPLAVDDAPAPARSSSRSLIDGESAQAVVFAAALAVGTLLLLEALGIIRISFQLVLALALSAAGTAVLWRQVDEAQRERWLGGGKRWVRIVRTIAGVALVVVGVAIFLAVRGDLSAAREGLGATLIVLAGLAVVTWPIWMRLVRELSDERRERIRSQARAEIAAHLHDSVLHTLTLIQRHVDDPKQVAKLARAQERALRTWLYGQSENTGMFEAAVERTAAEVEEAHGSPIDVVVVGDRPLDEVLAAQLAAAREAMVNAAKYGGGAPISVYAEVEDDAVTVFVKDRGPGFNADDVPSDRLGIRHSVIGRMQRHGGQAEVRSTQGEGTEVRLTMPLRRPPRAAADRPADADADSEGSAAKDRRPASGVSSSDDADAVRSES
jgi:signal transduction histidine kinase